METVNPKVPSTIEAAALCKMADRGQITGALLDGPLALDNAISADGGGDQADQLACRGPRERARRPDLEAGNMLAKSLSFLPAQTRRRHRARRAGADHPDQPRRLAAHAPRILRRCGVWSPPLAAPSAAAAIPLGPYI